MILHWLKSALAVVVLEGAVGVVAIQKMVTEDYRPWYGDSLSNLAIVRASNRVGARIMEDSPEVRSVLSRYFSMQHSSTFASERVAPDPNPELVHDLEGYPHFEVIAGAHCKILANTESVVAGVHTLQRSSKYESLLEETAARKA